ncbi:MAG: hypothetical protein ABL886_01750 [Rhodoglobus sp.]
MTALALDTVWTRVGVLCVVALVTVLLVASPAQAAPGQSSAQAAATDIELTPEDTGTTQYIATVLGSTASPPNGAVSIPAATVQADLGPTLGGVQDVLFFEELDADSSTDASGTASSASVGRMEVGTPAGALVITDVSSSVGCRGIRSASTSGPSAVTLGGAPVPLDVSGTTVLDLSPGFGTFLITLVTGTTSTDAHSASATGMTVRIDEDLPGLLTAYGTITLAHSQCESLALAATGGDPLPILPLGIGFAVTGLGLYALGRRPARP